METIFKVRGRDVMDSESVSYLKSDHVEFTVFDSVQLYKF